MRDPEFHQITLGGKHYHLESQIGNETGFERFVARGVDGDHVFIKLLRLEHHSYEDMRRALKRSAALSERAFQALSEIVVEILWYGDCEEGYGIVSRYVSGGSLRDWMNSESSVTASTRVLRMFRKIAGEVAILHAKGLMHFNLKPDNILLNGGGRPKLTDFMSLAYTTSRKRRFQKESSGFVAPECHKRDRAAGPLADVYTLGAVLFYLCTGSDPAQREENLYLLPPKLQTLVTHACRYDPNERPKSVALLLSALAATQVRPWWHWVAIGVGVIAFGTALVLW
ncbi:MAG: protein kinase, partial [Planctomycetes bacterium]|nr:protein kinase [Planctomycetota bacterium]